VGWPALEHSEGIRVPYLPVPVTIGVCGQASLVVTESDTALALGTGEVAVLATPRLVQLCEQATLVALGPRLAHGKTTVVLRIEFTHLSPVSVGSEVVATATLERSEGRRLLFSTTVTDACGLVAAGKVTRVLVETAPFMEKAR
jgi:fluoroacetyl-CoA thioesterase